MGRWIATLLAYSFSLAECLFSSAGTGTYEWRIAMFDLNPFHMGMDGNVDGNDGLDSTAGCDTGATLDPYYPEEPHQ